MIQEFFEVWSFQAIAMMLTSHLAKLLRMILQVYIELVRKMDVILKIYIDK
jgi:hypothetical protein